MRAHIIVIVTGHRGTVTLSIRISLNTRPAHLYVWLEVVSWGDAEAGGSLPAEVETLTDIVQVTGGCLAFAALRRNGEIIA